MMSAKMATLGLIITIFWNIGDDVIFTFNDVNNKILSRDSIYIEDVFMWPKFGNCIISIREVITTSVLWGFDHKGWSWFKFNNLGLALGANLKFYTSVTKGSKLKVTKCWGLILTFVEVPGEKLVGGLFGPHPPSWIGLIGLSNCCTTITLPKQCHQYFVAEYFLMCLGMCQ